MAESFDRASALERVAPDTHELVIPDGWQQGRGAFGGLVFGVAMSAMSADEPDATRVPRAFTGELCAPALPRRTRVGTRTLRRGNHQSNVTATVMQGDDVVAHASAVLAASRKAATGFALRVEPPARVRFEDATDLEIGTPFGPPFAAHYAYRPTSPLPFGGAAEAIVTGWIRERVQVASVTVPVVLARLDAFWPAFAPTLTAPRGMATVSFMAEILCDPSRLDPAAPLYYRARAVAHAGGYVVEFRELWHGDEPVAFNQQSFAILS